MWYPDRWWVCRHWRIWRVFRGLGSEEGHQLQQDRTQQVSGWSQCCSLWSRLWEVWKWWGSHCEFYVEYQLMLMFIIMQVLLVTGGKQGSGDSSSPLDSTEILETNTWRISAPLPFPGYGLKAASLGNTIFLFGEKIFCINLWFNFNFLGGHAGSFELNTILKYDATNQTWEEVGEMGEKRFGHTVALMEDVSKLCPWFVYLNDILHFSLPSQCYLSK